MALNISSDEQKKVIKARGLCIVNACPGAGKTRTVGARLMDIIVNEKLSPFQGVAALSFTNVAIDEIKRAYNSLSSKIISNPNFIGTLDSFLLRYIFLPFGHLVMGNKSIPAECLEPSSNYLDNAYKWETYKWDQPTFKLFKAMNFKFDNFTYDKAGKIKCNKTENQKLLDSVEIVKNKIKAKNIATLSDSNYFALDIIRKYPIIIRILKCRFPYIIIDEAQDCSDVQMAIIDKLAENHDQIMLIGDPHQSIYEFRTAQPELFIQKLSDNLWNNFILEKTWRCRTNIASLVNRCQCNDHHKMVISSAESDSEGNIEIIKQDKFENIIKNFVELVKKHKICVSKESVAVIYGAYSSDISLQNIDDNKIKDLFLTDSEKRKLHSLPLLAKKAYIECNYKKALNIGLCFVLKLQGKGWYKIQISDNAYEKEIPIKLKTSVWQFIKNLPSEKYTFIQWIDKTNELIKAFSGKLQLKESIKITQNKNYKDKISKYLDINADIAEDVTVKDLIINTSSSKDIPDIIHTNLHQVKGQTYDAVLIYLDEGRKRFNTNRLKRMLNGRTFSEYNEHDRCMFVAISRAKYLLCFAGHIDGLDKILGLKQGAY